MALRTYAIAMTVCDRSVYGGEDLLGTTMESLRQSGLWQHGIEFRMVLSDTGSPSLTYLHAYQQLPNVQVIVNQPPVQQVANAGRLMLHVAQEHGDLDYMIYLEDDVLFCDNWLLNVDGWAQRYLTSEDAFATLYAPYLDLQRCFNEGRHVWDEYPIAAFYGAQCFVVPMSFVAHLGHTLLAQDQAGVPGFVDIQIQHWYRSLKLGHQIKASVPSLVQHIDRSSTLATPRHQSPCFLGVDNHPKLY